MNSPFISVIVPVFNVELYLNQCVNSILSQSFEDYEIILVDDGSTDSSGRICDLLAASHEQIKAYHKANGGLSSARNFGFQKSQGKYVIFIDSDDFWLNNYFLESVYNKCESKEYDVIRAEYVCTDMGGNAIDSSEIEYKKKYENGTFGSFEMMQNILNGEYFTWLFVFRHDILNDISFNEQLKFQEDIDFAIRLFSKNLNCGYMSMFFYAYRQRENSIMSTPKIENLYHSFSFCQLFYHYAYLVEDERLREYYIHNGIMMYCWTIRNLAENYYFERISDIDKKIKLNRLRKQVLSWASLVKKKRFPISLYMNPYLFVYLLRLRKHLKFSL